MSFQATDGDVADVLTTTVSVTGGTLTGVQAGFNESFPFAPAGAVSPHTVSLTGTASTAGTIQLTILVDDGTAQQDTYTLDITINAANVSPVLAAPSGTVGISVGGSDPTFTGTATVGGNLAITFDATDANGSDTLTTTVTVTGGTLTGAQAGFNESFPFAPAGSTSPHSVSLTGTAANAGTIQLTISVDDGNSGTDSYTIDITISAANVSPVLGAPSGTVGITVGGSDPNFTGSATVGGNLAITFNATDANGSDTLTTTVSVTGGTLTGAQAGFNESFPFAPAGSTSPHAVSLTGTAANAGTIVLTVSVDDGNSGTDQYVITITIAAAGSPAITVTASLTAFTTTGVGVPSTQQSYTVSGANLTADIVITPPTDFQISLTSGSGFATTPINLTPAGGSVSTTSIFVRYNPTTGGPHNQVIAHTSTGATTQNLNVSGSIPAPAAASMSAAGNPGSQNANPGSTRTALGFRVTETGGGSPFTVTSVTVRVTTINNAGGVAVSAISSIALRRGGSVLGTHTSATWSVAGDVITLNYTGLSSVISAGTSADFTVAITFAGTSVPSPSPSYVAEIQPADVNSGSGVSGATVTGGTLTLVEALPGDPLDEDKDDDSCNLATRGGPAWPLLLAGLLIGLAAFRRRKTA
ncbi:MAG: hypothetical protein H6840_02050 [Planctomycetes bacterium]|nr:hypothetical protein [Planctomycetota bacterium]